MAREDADALTDELIAAVIDADSDLDAVRNVYAVLRGRGHDDQDVLAALVATLVITNRIDVAAADSDTRGNDPPPPGAARSRAN